MAAAPSMNPKQPDARIGALLAAFRGGDAKQPASRGGTITPALSAKPAGRGGTIAPVVSAKPAARGGKATPEPRDQRAARADTPMTGKRASK